jgi:hypothetical protein
MIIVAPIKFTDAILHAKHQIDRPNQQIEAADPKDRPHLQYQLKELQLWQPGQRDNRPPGSGSTGPERGRA